MEELWELRRHIEAGDYEAALALLNEMEAMALRRASLEACEGIYTAEQLAAMHERHQVLHDAWAKIRHLQQEHNSSD